MVLTVLPICGLPMEMIRHAFWNMPACITYFGVETKAGLTEAAEVKESCLYMPADARVNARRSGNDNLEATSA